MKHPARYSKAVLREFQVQLDLHLSHDEEHVILDPFGGVGGIHDLEGYYTQAVEIEPEWASESYIKGETLCADSRKPLPFPPGLFSAIATSPCYGNRMADHHEAKDGSYRRTYRHLLGRKLTEGNAGAMQWGEEYRQLHIDVYSNVTPLVKDGGLFLLNIKDHIRKGEIVLVSQFHVDTLHNLGWDVESVSTLSTPGFRFGANRQRLPEMVYTFRKSNG